MLWPRRKSFNNLSSETEEVTMGSTEDRLAKLEERVDHLMREIISQRTEMLTTIRDLTVAVNSLQDDRNKAASFIGGIVFVSSGIWALILIGKDYLAKVFN
jgi:hypothetical protein